MSEEFPHPQPLPPQGVKGLFCGVSDVDFGEL